MSDRLLRPGVELPEWQVQLSFARSGGPGGQHVNRTETKVVARIHVPSIAGLTRPERDRVRSRLASRLTKDDELMVTVSTSRSRDRNIQEAYDRLAGLIRGALRKRKRRRRTRPTRGSKERRLRAKKHNAEKKKLRKPPKYPR